MNETHKKKKSHHGFWIFILMLFGTSIEPGDPSAVPFAGTVFLSILMLAVLLFFVWLVRGVTNREKLFDRNVELTKVQKIMAFVFFAYLLVIYLLNGNIQSILKMPGQSAKILLSCFFTALGAGFFEDYFSRGYLLNLMQRLMNRFNIQKNRLLISGLTTSLCFGLLHLINLDGHNTAAVFQQIFYAFCIGLSLFVVRILLKYVWVSATFHFIFDFSLTIVNDVDSSDWLEVFIVFSIALVISLIMLFSLQTSIERQGIKELQP